MAENRSPARENVISSTNPSVLTRTLVGFAITSLLAATLFGVRTLAPKTGMLLDLSATLSDLAAPTVAPAVATEGLKLAGAVLIGVLVTFVQRLTRRERPLSRPMEQAQVLLCVAGALTMTIIGNSLPRAFGIAGAASIIRFRTPVDNPRDITVLFLLMALGMATGLGAGAVAFAGTLFVCGCLVMAPRDDGDHLRAMSVLVVADGPEFPTEHVARVFADHGVATEPIEISRDANAAVRYRAVLGPGTSLEDVTAQLIERRVKSILWQAPKKGR